MNNYAKTVLWLGLFMIVAGLARNWSVISSVLFASNPSGLKVPGPGGIPKLNGKCPPGYISAYGRCWGGATDPIPPKGGGLV